MIAYVKTALPGALVDDEREWKVLLSCGHEATVVGRKGLRPKPGNPVSCPRCDETPPEPVPLGPRQ